MTEKGKEKHESEEKGERISKVMSRAGLCSRRDAERWIEAGRVSVNGAVLTTPACVVTAADVIEVDGQLVGPAEKTRLFLYHKPAGLVTTARDEKGRPTVFENLPPDMPRVISVGRLDMNTEGLLLLTNNGGLSRHLELPATGWKRTYRVRAHGPMDEARLAALKDGITIDGVTYGEIDAALERTQGTNSWLVFSIREGKNREVRRVLEHLNLTVNRLIRISYGPFELGDLPEGAVHEVSRKVAAASLPEFFA